MSQEIAEEDHLILLCIDAIIQYDVGISTIFSISISMRIMITHFIG